MARIRTIKPEFPHSESMGRVSRDARLLFIQLWTLADDSGRLRGNSRILASLLYPYDDDAKDLMDDWLAELDRERCIDRYVVDGATYLQIVSWSEHQKIDKPSASKLPEFDEASRVVAKPREKSRSVVGGLDQEWNGLEGKGKDLSRAAAQPRDEFIAELQAVYPKRAGSHRWPEARQAINARLTEGHTRQEILEGAKRYAAFIRAQGKERTEFVQQAATFVGTNKAFLESWDLPAAPQDPRIAELNARKAERTAKADAAGAELGLTRHQLESVEAFETRIAQERIKPKGPLSTRDLGAAVRDTAAKLRAGGS